MDFAQKIDKVLKTNKKEIRSIGALESFLQLGLHTLRSAIKEGREPSRKVQVKIVEGMGISWDWWDTGKGEIFSEKGTPVGQKIVPPGDSTTPLLMVIEAKSKLITFLEAEVARLNKELAECRNALSLMKKS